MPTFDERLTSENAQLRKTVKELRNMHELRMTRIEKNIQLLTQRVLQLEGLVARQVIQ